MPAPTLSHDALCPADLPSTTVAGLYVHIPFCFHKCHYCDFYSITRQTPQRMDAFVDLLLAEADFWASGPGPRIRPRTIFFGGGTPTLLPPAAMDRLLDGLIGRMDLSALAEWTVEANPATVSDDYCRMLRRHGVDRMSFGAQSFHPAELATLERHHIPSDVPQAIAMARRAGFARLNLDLIYGIPGQTLDSWLASLDAALDLDTGHLSCYGLTFEPNTPIAVKKRLGLLRRVEESVELEMLHATRRRLDRAGLSPYEISNYSRPGDECRHNLMYWDGGDYIGLGPSAASHVAGTRWRNRPHLGAWESAIADSHLPAADVEFLQPLQRCGEIIMLQLRLQRGVNFNDFAERTGYDARDLYSGPLRQLQGLGLLRVDDRGFVLSDQGLNVADAIAAEFILHI